MSRAVLAGLLGLALASSASAAIVINALPQGDGVFNDVSGAIYDSWSSTDPSISAHYQFFGTSDTMSRNTGYMQYSLAGLVAADIQSVLLYLNIGSAYRAGSTPNCGYINHASNSAGATGQSSQRIGGNQLVATITDPISGWYSFDVTAMVKNDVTMGYAWSAFSVSADETGDYSNRSAGFNFTSAESGSPSYLSVAVPEPASLSLLWLISAGLLRRRPA